VLTKTQIESLQKNSKNTDTKLLLMFNALSDPGRFKVFKILRKNKNICVSDVAGILNVSVPAASRQLKVLELAGLIEKSRSGQMMCFKVNEDNKQIKSIVDII